MTQERTPTVRAATVTGIPCDFVTPTEAACLLRVSKGALYERIGRGDIQSYRFGRAIRLRAAHLSAYLERHRSEPPVRPTRYAGEA